MLIDNKTSTLRVSVTSCRLHSSNSRANVFAWSLLSSDKVLLASWKRNRKFDATWKSLECWLLIRMISELKSTHPDCFWDLSSIDWIRFLYLQKSPFVPPIDFMTKSWPLWHLFRHNITYAGSQIVHHYSKQNFDFVKWLSARKQRLESRILCLEIFKLIVI